MWLKKLAEQMQRHGKRPVALVVVPVVAGRRVHFEEDAAGLAQRHARVAGDDIDTRQAHARNRRSPRPVLHEGGADKCCSGRVVLLPARRVQSVIVARDQADLDRALDEFDIQLNRERGNGGPEVR